MEIRIDGHRAVMKEGTSFQYISENRSFTDSESYTFNIVFPLRGCVENQKIFGNIERADVAKKKINYTCEIIDIHLHVRGKATVTEVTEEQISLQFLGGKAYTNYAEILDNTYIDEMKFGYGSLILKEDFNKNDVRLKSYNEVQEVALPFFNNNSGEIYNDYKLMYGTIFVRQRAEVYQPYFMFIIYRVIRNIGYKMIRNDIENTPFRNIIVCNVDPRTMHRDYKYVLPHWTVAEFFDQVEKLFNCEVRVNEESKEISICLMGKAKDQYSTEHLKEVLDSYKTEISESEEASFRWSKNIGYEDPGYNRWKFSVLGEEIKNEIGKKEFDTFEQMVEYCNTHADVAQQYIYYTRDLDTDFIYYPGNGGITAVNEFSSLILNEGKEIDEELKIVPVEMVIVEKTVTVYDQGRPNDKKIHVQIPCVTAPLYSDAVESEYGTVAEKIENGNGDGKESIYDKIYIAMYDGVVRIAQPDNENPDYERDFPEAWTDRFSYLIYNNKYRELGALGNLRFTDKEHGIGSLYRSCDKIDTTQQVTKKFISRKIPEPRSEFNIGNKRYLCSKITGTFTEKGMQQPLEGIFYPLE